MLGKKSVLQHTLDAVIASGLPWYLERSAQPGMGDSIAAAVACTAQAPGWLILPADLPLVRSDTLRSVAEALRQHPVVVPVYQGRRGHPVGFSACCAHDLQDLQGDRGAASVVRRYAAFELALNDAGCVTDIDTLGDLRAAERLLGDAA